MISSTFPYPPTRRGTQVRTFNLLQYLSQRHCLTLVTQREPDVTDAEIQRLQNYVERLIVFDRPSDSLTSGRILKKIQRFTTFMLQGTPPSVLNRYSVDMQNWIDNFVEAGKCDGVLHQCPIPYAQCPKLAGSSGSSHPLKEWAFPPTFCNFVAMFKYN